MGRIDLMGDQRDRMLRGEWYLDEPDLVEDRRRCWRLLDRYNATLADDDDQRRELLDELLGEVGEDTIVMPRLQCSYGKHLSLGTQVFINSDVLLMDDAPIRIDDHVRIGPRSQLLTALHPIEDHERRRDGWERPEPIEVGTNAWLGAGVIVCPGITIGENAVVGAGSVVTRSVGSHLFVAGNPARLVRRL